MELLGGSCKCVGIHRKHSESIRPGQKLAGYPNCPWVEMLTATVRDLRSRCHSCVHALETRKAGLELQELAFVFLTVSGR